MSGEIGSQMSQVAVMSRSCRGHVEVMSVDRQNEILDRQDNMVDITHDFLTLLTECLTLSIGCCYPFPCTLHMR